MQFVKNKEFLTDFRLSVQACSSISSDYYIKADIMSWTIGKTTTATTEGEKDMK